MPNWCYNELVITGPVDQVEKFVEAAKPKREDLAGAYAAHRKHNDQLTFEQFFEEEQRGQPLSFQSVVPYKQGEFVPSKEDMDSPLAGLLGLSCTDPDEEWYRHNLLRWGTKWDANFTHEWSWEQHRRDDGSGYVQYDFDTAWSPPSAFVKNASKLFPSLSFSLKFAEPGCDFAGREVYRDGEMTDEEELDIKDVIPDYDDGSEEEEETS
jgi:hypothetical protein